MKRFHVHMAVENLPQSIDFYSALFAAQPAVVKTDYAKWMLDDPGSISLSRRAADNLASIISAFRWKTPESCMRFMRGSMRRAAESPSKVKPPAATRNRRKSWIDDPAGVAWETFLTTGQSIVYGDGTGERDARVVRDKQSVCCVPEAAAIAAT